MHSTRDINSSKLDCLIIGAGPAGLTALEYLARFHRNAMVLGSSSASRVGLIERTYNLPGYPAGISGTDLLGRLREQATAMGGVIRDDRAERIEGEDGAFVTHLTDGRLIHSRKIILAMGVTDREPDIPGIAPHIGKFVRYCPVCDGYEHTNGRLGVLGSGPAVVRHAVFLRTFSRHVTIFLDDGSPARLKPQCALLEEHGIATEKAKICAIVDDASPGDPGQSGCGVELSDGTTHRLDVLYSALGCDVNKAPVQNLNLKCDDEGYIITDCKQETSVQGIYAAGDIVSQINQICVAFGQAAVAAVELHNALGEA